MSKILIAAISTILISGCATNKSIYHWGNYSELVREMYVEPGKAPPDIQIEKLTTDIATAEENGKKVPPGLYTHLAMMYAAAGKQELSRASLAKEKQLFPESSTFINTLVKNQQGAKK